MGLIQVGQKEAEKVLRMCCDPMGLKASGLETGYPQVWSRDSMITMLGAILLDDKKVITSIKQTLLTFRENQTDLGLIPASIVCKDKKKDFRAYIDGNAWYVIGHDVYFQRTKDKAFLEESWESIQKTLQWLECQDVYQSGLIAMQEAADWMDMFAVSGRGLSMNCLYHQALQSAAKFAELFDDASMNEFYLKGADLVKQRLQEWFWVDIDNQSIYEDDFLNEELNILYGHKQALLRYRPYFLPYIGFRRAGTWFDTLGNLLSILFGIADDAQTAQILDYIKQTGSNAPHPVKSAYPTVHPGDVDWRDYYLNKNLNLPDQYHNGGIWPFIGGFYIAALVKAKRFKEAEEQMEKLAQTNKKGKLTDWEFNEWFHGVSGEPMGHEYQAWSAGMYLYAAECLKQKKLLFFAD